MRKVFTFLAAVLLTASVFAQAPEKMSYQAVIRNSSDQLVTNQSVGMQISILQGSTSGTAVYVERHFPTTNANGLVTMEIGTGTVISGDFTTIDWANGPYFVKTETDLNGGANYTITGTSQLLSVPYALHAETAETLSGGITETDPVYTSSEAANITATDITNLGSLSGTNTGDQDISGIATNATAIAANMQAIQDTAAQVRADIPDVSGFIVSETDPVYTAWDKDYADLTNTPATITTAQADAIAVNSGKDTAGIYHANRAALDLVSGTNTGDQDISGIATNATAISANTQAIQDTAAQIRADIPTNNNQLTNGAGYLTSYTETDPIYSSSVASGITGTDKTNWNNKQDHLTAGTGIDITGNTISATTYSVGDFAQGGIVFWVDETGQHGLVCAKKDQSTGVRWYAGTYGYTQAKGDGPFAGEANTSIIIAAQVAIGDDGNTYAARICNELKITEGGKTYGDWYLPSKEELNLMYHNKATINTTATAHGGSSFAIAYYWSSTEYINSNAWEQWFGNGAQYSSGKGSTNRVRAVRAF